MSDKALSSSDRKPPASSTDDAAFLRGYDANRYALPSVTVDICALCVLDNDLKALLVQRGRPPFEGQWALPGTFVRVASPPSVDGGPHRDTGGVDETLDAAATRALTDKAGMPSGRVPLRQLLTVGPIDRDPRTRVVTIVFVALVQPELAAFWRATTTPNPTQWRSYSTLTDAPALAFDHAAILTKARARLIRDMHSVAPTMAFDLAPSTFTIGELRSTVEAVTSDRIDPGNFRRRFLAWEADGRVQSVPGTRVTGRRRAAVYKRT